MGTAAAQAVFRRLRGNQAGLAHTTVPATVIPRKSLRPAEPDA